ncbi:amidohydrolase family protein [Sphingobium sp. DEHP117]|uniref:amidohydrolase family protein n=1 Tax=Sphingobium sp. DEHP117 TaxID=2993436 RepID=UPI0027D76AE7|nr:amidohydrolase family protein [Sphingobium sp. DEHP117]MDQ4420937.1 amidohydrolase family protein [Sphingobium sp. DEHP117]
MTSSLTARLRTAFATFLALALLGTPALARKKAPPAPPPATTGLVDNINGIAVGEQGVTVHFTGLLIGQDGRVERRLTRDDKRPDTLAWRYDAKGRTLIPSFVDGHARVIATGLRLMTLDLSATRSLAEAQAMIAAHARANPAKKWILGSGWDAARWGAAAPTAAQLDAAVADTPAWLESADGRTGWANSAALRLAGMKETGALSGAAKRQMERVVPAPSPKDRDIALDKAQRFFLERGISAAADMGTTILDWQAYRRAGDRGALRLRIIGYAEGIEHMATIAGPAPSPWLYDDRLRLIGVHLPVENNADATRLGNQASRAAMDNFQIALTPEGEPALQKAATVMRELAESYPGDRRWRTEPIDAALPSFALLAQHARREGAIGNALATLTRRAAQSAFAEQPIGALSPGQWADFLLIDRDIATATPDEIAATRIVEHWIGGKLVWKSEAP